MKGLLFTYALTFGGAGISLFRPFYGFLAYLLFAVVRPEFLWPWSVPLGGNYSRIIAIGLLLGWAIHGFGNWRFGRAKWIVLALAGYAASILSSALFAENKDLAWRVVDIQVKVLLPVLVGFTLVTTLQEVKMVAWTLVLGLGYLAFEFNLDYLQGGTRLLLQGFGGMDNNSISIAMVTGCGLAFFLGLYETAWWRRWGLFVAAGLMAHTPMFGSSRGGMVALLVTGVATFVVVPKRPATLSLFGLAVVAGLLMAGPSVIEEFSTVFADAEERDASAESRLDLWVDCWDAMLTNPVSGLGPGHWEPASRAIYGWSVPKAAHSRWFHTAAELGVPGITSLLAFFGLAYWQAWRLAWKAPPELAQYARMAFVSLSGFLVATSFVTVETMEPPYYVVIIVASVLRLTPEFAASAARAAANPAAATQPDLVSASHG